MFGPEFFEAQGFTVGQNPECPNDPNCIVAYSQHIWDYERDRCKSVKDTRKITMNLNGYGMEIKEDWDTRRVFYGRVETEEDLITILRCIM